MTKVWFGIIVLILPVLACQLFSPPSNAVQAPPMPTPAPVQPTQPTQAPQIEYVFRPVSEMNLAPEDLSGYESLPIEAPVEEEPLAPEVLEKDEKAFQEPTQNIVVETVVIMVPSRPGKSLDAYFDRFLARGRRCHSRCWWDGEYLDAGEAIQLGEFGTIRTIRGTCGKGYVSVFVRSNIITFVAGCGKAVDQRFILRLGQVIDGRIGAPPKPKELSNNQPKITYTPTPGICERMELTPEECANAGEHYYYCDGLKQYRSPSWHFNPLPFNYNQCLTPPKKVAVNTYECPYPFGDRNNISRIEFTMEGYIMSVYDGPLGWMKPVVCVRDD